MQKISYIQKLVYMQNVLTCKRKFNINSRKILKVKSENIWQSQFQSKVFCKPIIYDLAYLKA